MHLSFYFNMVLHVKKALTNESFLREKKMLDLDILLNDFLETVRFFPREFVLI